MSMFDRTPFIVIWETTRACALACVHCRAEAIARRHPDELTTEEGQALIDRVAAFGDPPPLLVFTGGDPLRRPDIETLVAHATRRRITASMTPSGTAAVTEKRLRALKNAGLARLAVSLDGATAEVHDAFRRVRGSHGWTMRIVEHARALELPLQINTTVCRRTVADLPALARQIEDFGVVLWALFFLIPVGRAQADQALPADVIEAVLEWAAGLARRTPFGVKTTEAPHYHRVLAQRGAQLLERLPVGEVGSRRRPDLIGRAGRAVTDGNGFVFIDHLGNICPSGFLPMTAGNVRTDDLVRVYRDAALFRDLRDPVKLGGRCGRCEYRERCSGSRARAFAVTGDPLAEDPGCAWQPAASVPGVEGATRTDFVPDGGAAAPREIGVPAIAGGSGATRVSADASTDVSIASAHAPTALGIAQVTDALRGVMDPELGMSVVELGLIYGIDVDGGSVAITMTLTAAGCPLHEVMAAWVREAVARVPGVEHVDVRVTFDPPWTPDRLQQG